MTKTVTDAMVNAAYEAYWDAPDDVEDHASMRIALGAALAQSNAKPVGILHNAEAGFKEVVTRDTAAIYDNNPRLRLAEEIFDFDRNPLGFRVYDAPPRSDIAAGLVLEATKAELNAIRDCMIGYREHYDGLKELAGDLERVATLLRALASNRSGK